MNCRICPDCGGKSYSSYSGPNWDCPYCGKDLGNVPNELSDTTKICKQDAPPVRLYSIKGGVD